MPTLGLCALLVMACGGGSDDATVPPAWMPAAVQPQASVLASPRAVIDDLGTATVAWQHSGGYARAVRGSAASGWQAPVDLEPTSASLYAQNPTTLVAAGARTIVSWINLSSPDSFVVRAATFDGTWLPAHTVTPAGFAGDFVMAGNDNGDFVALWTEYDRPNNLHFVISARKTGGGPWSAPVAVGPGMQLSPSWPNVAINAQGESAALWLQGSRVLASRLQAGAQAWSAPTTIDGSQQVPGVQPQLVALRDGRFAAAWVQLANNRASVYGSSLTASGWQPAVVLELDDRGDANEIHLSREGPAGARAVWAQSEGQPTFAIREASFNAQGWRVVDRPVAPIETGIERSVPRTVSDRLGNTMVAWRARPIGGGLGRIEYTYRDADTGTWRPPTFLSDPEVVPGSLPSLAVNDRGQAVVAWIAQQGTTSVVVTRLLQP